MSGQLRSLALLLQACRSTLTLEETRCYLLKKGVWPKVSYQELADVACDLIHDHLTMASVLERICMRKFADVTLTSAVFFQLGKDGQLHLRASFGDYFLRDDIEKKSLTIFDDHVAAESVRYSAFATKTRTKKEKNVQGRTEIAWPLTSNARVIGALVIATEREIEVSGEISGCLQAVAKIAGDALINASDFKSKMLPPRSNSSTVPENESVIGLSERQLLILKLISEGRTNADIADVLGYSESLIRQETIKIYSFLDCSGRSEATSIFLNSLNSATLTGSIV